ncbi:hypothetical protein [Pseudolysinimonas sp.]|uniref:hypothetical protein n=1 Tax=Pseudolysinimonas sp. TaxID=2680009 RepID=UPI003F81688B
MTVETVAERLQIHPGDRVAVIGADQDAEETIQPLPDVELVDDPADADIVLAFGDDLEQLELRIADVESASSAAHLWIMFPKDAAIDLDAFEEVADRNGFEVGAKESLDATWEALHLVR